MKNLTNLNSTEWCDIIFEGKNKSYGAFELRQSSSKRHIVAFAIVLVFVGLVAALPGIVSKIQAATKSNYNTSYTDIVSVIDVETSKPEEPIIEQPLVPEPPKFVNMTKFVPPTIVDDADAPDETEMANMIEVVNTKDAIGSFTVKDGSDDKDAVRKEFETEVMGGGTVAPQPQNKIFEHAEVMPQFPGGNDEMYRFIKDNLRYPAIDQEMGTQGRVTVRFVVSKTGEISNIQLLKGISPTCDKEAMRVIKSMPKWIPGRQNGELVQVYFNMPIVFKLN